MQTEKLTLEKLNYYMGDFYEVIEYARTFKPSTHERPHKPILANKATSDDVFIYGNLLKGYEDQMEKYKADKAVYDQANHDIESVIEEYVKSEAGLDDVPEQYRAKVYSYAYQEGHSSGWSGIYNHLIELVDIFN
jgi:hypothetical protein